MAVWRAGLEPAAGGAGAGCERQTVGSDTSTVTLAIQNNPTNGVLSGTSTAAVNAGTGVAAFSGLSIDNIGAGYTLLASGSCLTNATSAAFNVTANWSTNIFHGGSFDGWDRSAAPRAADLKVVTGTVLIV